VSGLSARSTTVSLGRVFAMPRVLGAHQPDYWLLTVILMLVMFGTVMVFSSSFAIGVREEGGDGYYFLTRHLIYLVLGLAGMLVAMFIDYRVWQRFALPGIVGAISLLVLMKIVPGLAPEVWGASRWIVIGPISFQPSELAKLALVIYLASWLTQRGARVKEFTYGLIPFAFILGGLIGLVMMQPDLGTSLLLAAIGVSMFLVAGASLLHLGVVSLVGPAAFLTMALSASYRRDRIMMFLDPGTDIRNLGWQLAQAKLAIGSGGLFGIGLGASRQKFSWLPAAHNDAIFAVIAEELGLVGCAFVLLMFLALAWRGYWVAMRAPDAFGTLVAVGIVTWMIFQAAINIGGITTTIPFTGIPIPFISYGGSSLVVSLTAMGILLNISRHTVDPVRVTVKTTSDSRSTRARRRATSSPMEPARGDAGRPSTGERPSPRRDESATPRPETVPSGGKRRQPARSVDGREQSTSGTFGRSRGADGSKQSRRGR
jgi:cell division protein FtsW